MDRYIVLLLYDHVAILRNLQIDWLFESVAEFHISFNY